MSAVKESRLTVVEYNDLDKKKQKIIRKWRLAKVASDRAAIKIKEARDAMATEIGVCKISLPDNNVVQITQSIREDIKWAKAFEEFVKLFWPVIQDEPKLAEKFTYFKHKAELTYKSPPTPRWEVREIKKGAPNAEVEGEN